MDLIDLAVMVDRASAVEGGTQDVDRFIHGGIRRAGRTTRPAHGHDGIPVRAGAESQFETTAAEQVEGDGLVGKHGGWTKSKVATYGKKRTARCGKPHTDQGHGVELGTVSRDGPECRSSRTRAHR